MAKQYKILAVHDVEKVAPNGDILRWAYAHRTHIIQKLAPDDFHVERTDVHTLRRLIQKDPEILNQYDLIFNLDYSQAEAFRKPLDRIKSQTRLVTSFNKDSRSRHKEWGLTTFWSHWTLVNNVDRYERGGIEEQTCCISNGVLLDQWGCDVPIEKRLHKIVWTGGEGARKNKGYADTLLPAKEDLEMRGFECDFRFVSDIKPGQVITHDQMRDWYNSASYVVCMSATEGTPNFILEGMACGCVPVSSVCGNIPELESVVKVPRDVISLIEGLERARDDRERLSRAAHDEIHNGWGYLNPDGSRNRIDYFFSLFRALINYSPRELKPFCYRDCTPKEIEANFQ